MTQKGQKQIMLNKQNHGITEPSAIILKNGYEIQSGWIDNDDPDKLREGDYLSVVDAGGKQVFYIDTADLIADPIIARQQIKNFLNACRGSLKQ